MALRGPKADHKTRAGIAEVRMKHALQMAKSYTDKNRCIPAYTSLIEAFEQSAVMAAEGGHSKSTFWHPHSDFRDISGDFTDKCLRHAGNANALDGVKLKRKRR